MAGSGAASNVIGINARARCETRDVMTNEEIRKRIQAVISGLSKEYAKTGDVVEEARLLGIVMQIADEKLRECQAREITTRDLYVA